MPEKLSLYSELSHVTAENFSVVKILSYFGRCTGPNTPTFVYFTVPQST